MNQNLRLVLALVLASAVLHGPAFAQSSDTGGCTSGGLGCELPAEAPSIELVITSQIQVFSDEGLDDGAARELLCPDGQVRLIREATVGGITAAEAPADGVGAGDADGVDDGTAQYSGGRCVSDAVVGGTQAIDSADILGQVVLPLPEVHHNPHSEVIVSRIPTWFWHDGPTTHSQQVSVPLDSGGVITGTYSGQIVAFCWTVDDPRGQLARRDDDARTCTAPPRLTTYVSDTPGEDTEDGAAATHTWTTHGFDTTITVEAVWSGTWTITSAPSDVVEVGLTLGVDRVVTRGQVTRPMRQIIPVLVPPG